MQQVRNMEVENCYWRFGYIDLENDEREICALLFVMDIGSEKNQTQNLIIRIHCILHLEIGVFMVYLTYPKDRIKS